MTTTRPHLTELGSVGIPVTDQDRALRFYRDVLGFEVRLDAPFSADARWIELAPAGAATAVALVQGGTDTRTGVDTGIRLTTTDAEADHRHLTEAGVDVDAEVLRWEGVPPMFTFRDPDGNVLYVVERPTG